MSSLKKEKSVVLLSSGLDSSVNLYEAHRKTNVCLGLTFDYGQRASQSEIRCAGRLCAKLGVPHRIVSLGFFQDWGRSSLVDHAAELPVLGRVDIADKKASEASAKSVWVPNRNGVFLNIAAGFAESLDCDIVVPGFNREEAVTFPDNSGAFLDSLNRAFAFSTANHVRVHCYTTELDKVQIVGLGQELGVPWVDTWPCYQNQKSWCGICESCLRAKRAFAANGVSLEKFMA